MAEEASNKIEAVDANEEGWPIFDVWDKYEAIAMHFNDLLIELRTQALAAVAALSTIIGIFSKSGGETQSTWQVVAFAARFTVVQKRWLLVDRWRASNARYAVTRWRAGISCGCPPIGL
jgi:hypothetical protein